jgi:hypothetical protein
LEEDYASDDSRSLEDYWWHEECLYNVDFFNKKRLLGEEVRERKRAGGVDCTNVGMSVAEEGLRFPPLEAHEPL